MEAAENEIVSPAPPVSVSDCYRQAQVCRRRQTACLAIATISAYHRRRRRNRVIAVVAPDHIGMGIAGHLIAPNLLPTGPSNPSHFPHCRSRRPDHLARALARCYHDAMSRDLSTVPKSRSSVPAPPTTQYPAPPLSNVSSPAPPKDRSLPVTAEKVVGARTSHQNRCRRCHKIHQLPNRHEAVVEARAIKAEVTLTPFSIAKTVIENLAGGSGQIDRCACGHPVGGPESNDGAAPRDSYWSVPCRHPSGCANCPSGCHRRPAEHGVVAHWSRTCHCRRAGGKSFCRMDQSGAAHGHLIGRCWSRSPRSRSWTHRATRTVVGHNREARRGSTDHDKVLLWSAKETPSRPSPP